MKKLLVAIPAAALLAGLLLFFWQRRETAPSASPPAPAKPAETPHAHEEKPAPASPTASPGPADARGLARILVTARGTPLAEAQILLAREGEPVNLRFTTGVDGIRSVLQMPPGHYVATVIHPKFLQAEKHFEIPAGGRADVTIDLKSGARIWGRVTDSAGAPLPGTNVMAIDGETLFTAGPHLSAKTDAEGRYELPPVPPGDFGVRFRHERYKVQDKVGMRVVSGAEEYEANARLETGARVEGRVVDEQGQPIAGADVQIANPKGGGITTSDAQGRFAVYGLPEEAVNASVSRKGYGTTVRRGIPPNTTDLEFRLPKGGAVAGRVLCEPTPFHFYVMMSRYDEELGRPLRVAPRSFSNAPGGEFRVDDLAPGLYWVEVESEDYEATDRPQVSVAPGQVSAGVTVRLRKK